MEYMLKRRREHRIYHYVRPDCVKISLGKLIVIVLAVTIFQFYFAAILFMDLI